MTLDALFSKFSAWAEHRRDIAAICVVGLHARGTARRDSDVDAVILCDQLKELFEEKGWREIFGDI